MSSSVEIVYVLWLNDTGGRLGCRNAGNERSEIKFVKTVVSELEDLQKFSFLMSNWSSCCVAGGV